MQSVTQSQASSASTVRSAARPRRALTGTATPRLVRSSTPNTAATMRPWRRARGLRPRPVSSSSRRSTFVRAPNGAPGDAVHDHAGEHPQLAVALGDDHHRCSGADARVGHQLPREATRDLDEPWLADVVGARGADRRRSPVRGLDTHPSAPRDRVARGDQRVRVQREAPSERVVVACGDADLEAAPLGSRARPSESVRVGAGASVVTSGNVERSVGAEARMSLVGASSVTTMPHPVRRTVTTSVSPSATPRITRRSPPDGAKTRPCTVALREERPGFRELRLGFPLCAAVTTDWSPWLHALKADATEASAARCAASFRRAVSAWAKSLASWRCCCASAGRPWTSSGAAPRGWKRASLRGRWPAAFAG